jgi:aminoglycoside/choline kinase family phosphotransferase
MHLDGRLTYIDFQRTCFGPLQYDVATLLFQSQANLSKIHRKDLLDYYLDLLESTYQISKNEFLDYYYEFVLVRLCEVLGTYGKFGLGQRKEYFLKGIPLALKNINDLFEEYPIHLELPELRRILKVCADEFDS